MDTAPQLGDIILAIAAQKWDDAQRRIDALDDAAVANLLEATPPRVRGELLRRGAGPSRSPAEGSSLLHPRRMAGVLPRLSEAARADVVANMDAAALAAVADELDADDLTDLLQDLPDALTEALMEAMSAADRARVEALLTYPEDTAGGLMNTDAVAVRPWNTVELVLRYLRRRRTLPDGTDSLFVVNAADQYVGALPIAQLLTAHPASAVRDAMDADSEPLPVTMPDAQVARRFAEQDLVSAPVVDADGRLAGRITVDDVVDVIIEDADETLLAQAGLDTVEETFAPVLQSARRRAVWLGVNLITAFLAAAVINLFEETIAEVIALAVLMPIVASMGGIAGTQTLTLVIRGMALGQIAGANLGWFLNREMLVAALNGLLWAALVALGAAIAFQDALLGMVIAAAMAINILIAALAGSLLPSILSALGIDPAIAGGVVLTTVTDVAGFFTFLGLAALAYG